MRVDKSLTRCVVAQSVSFAHTQLPGDEEALANVYQQIVATAKLFEAIKVAMQDATTPLHAICRKIRPEHDATAFASPSKVAELD